MTTSQLPRLGGACGVLFAVLLFVAAGDGSHTYSTGLQLAGTCALTLAVPFLASVCARLRSAEGPGGWLANTALASAVAGLAIKLLSAVPEISAHSANVTDGQLSTVLTQFANNATLVALYPQGLFCLAATVTAWRTRALPRWLAVITAVVGVSLIGNGSMPGTEAVPALLAFVG
jgi:hypothetical protein